MLGIKRDKETHVSKVVDLKSLPKVPRDPRMIANNGGVPLKGKTGFKRAPPSALTWTAGSKTKLTDGKSVLTRARREAKEMTQRGKLATPTGQLNVKHGQVKQAPAAMVKEYRTATQPTLKILSRKHGVGVTGGIRGPSLEEREARLRTAMAGSSSSRQNYDDPKATYVGSSDEEGDSGMEDLFDTPKPKSQHKSESSRGLPSFPSARVSSSLKSQPTSGSSIGGSSRPAPPRALSPSPPTSSRTSSPAPGPKLVMARKRPQVDIFNRGASKKSRQR